MCLLKRILFTLAAVAVLALLASPASAAGGGHDIKAPASSSSSSGQGLSYLSYVDATKKAAEENKLVMLFFWADWCRYCVQIRKEVFSLDKVRETFEKNFVAVSVDIENDPDNISGRFRPRALPTMAFVKPNGETIGVLPGAVDADLFLQALDAVIAEARK